MEQMTKQFRVYAVVESIVVDAAGEVVPDSREDVNSHSLCAFLTDKAAERFAAQLSKECADNHADGCIDSAKTEDD